MERERERRRPDQPGSAAPALPTNADFGVDGADGRLPAARPGRDDGDGVIDLDGWLALRDLTLDQARVKLGVDGEPGVRYEGLRPVRRLHNPAVHPGHFYFDGNHQVMQYIGAAGLDGVDPDELERTLGGPGEILPSRAGKSSAMHVYPDRGVAFSSDGHEVEILELFPPTTLADYRTRIYEDPGAFIK